MGARPGRARGGTIAAIGMWLLAFGVTLASAVAARPLVAQGPSEDGALFLLLPTGARAVGMGQAVVSDASSGSEGVWWNPGALARLEKREAAIHHSQSVIGTGDAITFLVPSSLLGVLALSVNILNYGSQEVTDEQGTIGSILPRSLVYAATYATPVGSRLSAGITYKVIQFRVDCSGTCPPGSTSVATSSALDAGVQGTIGGPVPLAIGAALRNVGPRLQVNDNPQSDPLPSRVQLGVSYRVAAVTRYVPTTELRVSSDVLNRLRFDDPTARIGAELSLQRRFFARAGYVFDDSEGGGPSVGLGLAAGSLVVDISRLFEGLSSEAGQAPTYFSLRYLF